MVALEVAHKWSRLCCIYQQLTYIVLPVNVKSIGDQAFVYCRLLSEIEIPYGVASIEFWTFGDCTSLKNTVIPGSVTSIENEQITNIVF